MTDVNTWLASPLSKRQSVKRCKANRRKDIIVILFLTTIKCSARIRPRCDAAFYHKTRIINPESRCCGKKNRNTYLFHTESLTPRTTSNKLMKILLIERWDNFVRQFSRVTEPQNRFSPWDSSCCTFSPSLALGVVPALQTSLIDFSATTKHHKAERQDVA